MLKVQNDRCCSLNQIREETNTKIDLPTENSNSEMIVITGKKINCEAARDRILAIQRELVSFCHLLQLTVFVVVFTFPSCCTKNDLFTCNYLLKQWM